jgi:protein XagA
MVSHPTFSNSSPTPILRLFASIVAVLILCSGRVNAGAWTPERGHGQIIFTSSFFQTGNSFGASGGSQPFGYNGKFRQINFNPYFEYELARRYTLIVNANAPLLKFWNSYGASSSAGLGDMEVGIKRRLNSVESPWAVSGQLSVMFPAYSARRNPAPGNHQEDIETRLSIGHGRAWSGHQIFWDAEAAYRYRYGPPADQFRADLTGGLNLNRRLMLMTQLFAIKSLLNGSAFSTTNPNAQSDFDLYKGQVSLVTSVTRGLRIQVGWNDAFSGRNTGGGHTAILAVWKTF